MNFKNWALACLMCISTAAFAQYKPSYTVVKSNSKFEINRDASYTQYLEEQTRVDTPQGIRMLGERKISYNSTLEDVEVLVAYTIQPDGTRIAVPLIPKTLENHQIQIYLVLLRPFSAQLVRLKNLQLKPTQVSWSQLTAKMLN